MLLINRVEEVVSSKKEIGIELNQASEVIFRVAKALQTGIVPNITVESDCWLNLKITWDDEVAGVEALKWMEIEYLTDDELVLRNYVAYADEAETKKIDATSWKVSLDSTPLTLLELINTLVNKNY